MVKSGSPRGRWLCIDVLRALAVVLMVEQHLGVWLFSMREATGTWGRFLVGLNLLGGVAAPLFILLSGVGVALGSHQAKALVARGFGLLLCGYLLNLATPSWFTVGSWYVLHLLGFWLVISPTIRRFSNGALLALSGAVVGTGILGQLWLATPPHLPNARLSDAGMAGGVLRLATFEGHFPVFPWLALAILGLWGGRQLKQQRKTPLLILCGSALLLAVLTQIPLHSLGRTAARSLPWRALGQFSFYPVTGAFILVLAAVCLALLALAGWVEGQGWLRSVAGLRYLGRTSLTLLFVHIVVFREGSSALGLRNQYSALPTLSIVVFLLVSWTWLSKLWARVDFRYSLEWWLRRCSH